MGRLLFAFVVALAAASPAYAVDIINRDSINHRVFICGDGCKPDYTSPNRGIWITLAPGELRTNVCQAQCVMIVSDDDNIDPGDFVLSTEFSGSDVVAIRDGKVDRD
ncbi:MAG: hypothetical protein GC190_19545 [Alphaproteobacteria bacterium]|nr:hypothetical protein [Alphaproteobacteria bacterium]